VNAEIPGPWLRGYLRSHRKALREVDRALDAGTLSLRGADRVLRIACTVGDLRGHSVPSAEDVGLAMMLRMGKLV
jgi:magnesium chelatase family protein